VNARPFHAWSIQPTAYRFDREPSDSSRSNEASNEPPARGTAAYYDSGILPAALRRLADVGPAAQEATGDWEIMTRDPNPAMAKLATEALVKIRR
jgi:hypothetical protein